MGSLESDTTEQLHFHFLLSCVGEGNGNPLQCSCLENPRDGEAWWAAVYGVTQSRTRLKRLSNMSCGRIFLSWLTISVLHTKRLSQDRFHICIHMWRHVLQPTGLFRPWSSPGKSTGVGCHFLLQGTFPTQGLNPSLPHCRQTHQESPESILTYRKSTNTD